MCIKEEDWEEESDGSENGKKLKFLTFWSYGEESSHLLLLSLEKSQKAQTRRESVNVEASVRLDKKKNVDGKMSGI